MAEFILFVNRTIGGNLVDSTQRIPFLLFSVALFSNKVLSLHNVAIEAADILIGT